jgi:dGTPase
VNSNAESELPADVPPESRPQSLHFREEYEAEEAARLAGYALPARRSRGRLYPEAPHAYRTAFQRDRDRIVHAHAFRRLEYKTQVFIFHEGDHYRNRLTHTLEASQIARTIARVLRANEDLAEAIVLAHDLGHTPFGHAGEHALARLMAADGGFDHNRQTLRIVDWLEDRYPSFRGLNLTDETREGILKHGAQWEHPVAVPPLAANPSVEAQVSDVADEIAYLNHDLDDGLRSGLLTAEQLGSLRIWREAEKLARERHGKLPGDGAASSIAALIDMLTTDLVVATRERLEAVPCRTVEDVRDAAERVVGYSAAIFEQRRELREFLFENLYYHPRVLRMSRKAERILTDLYNIYRDEPRQLPRTVTRSFAESGEARAVADYIAGMTDRFALSEHRKLLDPHEPV